MSRRLASLLALALVLTPLAASGQAAPPPLDSAAGRAQLEEGYALKSQGRYADALPHFVESQRLDPQVKTLLNLADCEEHLGQLASAQRIWLEVRDQAPANSPVGREAAARLVALEHRMPRLVLVLSDDAPSEAEVTRDGVVLGRVSLGIALPADPGEHIVVLRAPGREEALVKVVLAEGETKRVVLAAGPPRAIAVARVVPAEPVVSADHPAVAPLSEEADRSPPAVSGPVRRGPLFWGGTIAAAGGVASGLVLGAVALGKTKSLSSECPGGVCTSVGGRSDYETARSLALASDVAFAVAGAGAIVAVVGFFTARGGERARSPAVSLWIGPRGAGVGGRFQ